MHFKSRLHTVTDGMDAFLYMKEVGDDDDDDATEGSATGDALGGQSGVQAPGLAGADPNKSAAAAKDQELPSLLKYRSMHNPSAPDMYVPNGMERAYLCRMIESHLLKIIVPCIGGAGLKSKDGPKSKEAGHNCLLVRVNAPSDEGRVDRVKSGKDTHTIFVRRSGDIPLRYHFIGAVSEIPQVGSLPLGKAFNGQVPLFVSPGAYGMQDADSVLPDWLIPERPTWKEPTGKAGKVRKVGKAPSPKVGTTTLKWGCTNIPFVNKYNAGPCQSEKRNEDIELSVCYLETPGPWTAMGREMTEVYREPNGIMLSKNAAKRVAEQKNTRPVAEPGAEQSKTEQAKAKKNLCLHIFN